MKNFRLSQTHKLKGFADDNLKFYDDVGKFSKWVENIVEKGEIDCYRHSVLKRLVL